MNYILEIIELVSKYSDSAQVGLDHALNRLHGSDAWESFAHLLLSQVLALTSGLVVYTLVIIPSTDPSLSRQLFVRASSSLSSIPLVTASLSRCTVAGLEIYRMIKSCMKAIPLLNIIVRIFCANFESRRRKFLRTDSNETQSIVSEFNRSVEDADIPIIGLASENARPPFDAVNEATLDVKADSINETETNTDLTATDESDTDASAPTRETDDIELNDTTSVSDASYLHDMQVSVERLDVRVEKQNQTRNDLTELESPVPADTENCLTGFSPNEEMVPAQFIKNEALVRGDPVEVLFERDEKGASLKLGEPEFEISPKPAGVYSMSAVDCEEQMDSGISKGDASVAADASGCSPPTAFISPCTTSTILEHLEDPTSYEIWPKGSKNMTCIKSAPLVFATEKIAPATTLTQENTDVLMMHSHREGHEYPISWCSSPGQIATNALNETTLRINNLAIPQPPLCLSTLAPAQRFNNGLSALSSVENREDQMLLLDIKQDKNDQTNEISDGSYGSALNAGDPLLECSFLASVLDTDITSSSVMEAMQANNLLKGAIISSCETNLEVPPAPAISPDGSGPLNMPRPFPMSVGKVFGPNPVCSSNIPDSEVRDFPSDRHSVPSTVHETLERLTGEMFKAPDAQHLRTFDHDRPDGKEKVPPIGSANSIVDNPPESKDVQQITCSSTASARVNPFTSNVGLWASIHAPSKSSAKGGLSRSLSGPNTNRAGSTASIYTSNNVFVNNSSRKEAAPTRTASLTAPRQFIQSRSPKKKGLTDDNPLGPMLSSTNLGTTKGAILLESYSQKSPSRTRNERKGRIHLGRPRTAPSAMPIN